MTKPNQSPPQGPASPSAAPSPAASLAQTRAEAIERILAGNEALMHALSAAHAPEFLEIGVTMPQAKALYLMGAAGSLGLSALADQLGVAISTASELIDRLVDQGLVERRDDPDDRRHLLLTLTPDAAALLDRFRELNRAQFRALLDRMTDAELDVLVRAMEIFLRVVADANHRPENG